MDAPTTTSADNGTSGGSGGGGGWFTPRKPVTDRPAESGAARADGRPGEPSDAGEAPDGSQERIAGPRRPLTSIRMVGTGATRTTQPKPAPGDPAPHSPTPAPGTPTPAPGTPAPRTQAPDTQALGHQGPRTPVTGTQGPGSPAPAAQPLPNPAPPSPAPESDTPGPSDVPWPGGSPEPVREHPADRHTAPTPQDAPVSTAYAADRQGAAYDAPGGHDAPSRQGAEQPAQASTTPAAAADADPDADAPARAAAVETGSPDAVRVRRTLAEVGPVADKVTSYFYALLFTRNPELRALFPAAMEAQRDRLLKALLTAAEHMDNAAVLTDYLQHLGRGHRKYGTEASHYPAVGEALIGALSRYATTTWDEETEAAWVRTYTTISQIMIDAAAENERHAPAWWHAEVVSHDLRTPDIAVITVRPDQPYPFLAGQYTSLETPWWPRIWRHYSFASAPRSDGLLSFHVKAVPAGWVSNALVHHARPGDVLRLGPPAGSMTVDHTTDNGLLCLGGGTGIAPIKALVEDVAEHGARRPVEVFYGARTDHDLYDIDTMLRLQQSHPWLEVRAIIDGKTQLPDVVREYGPWNEYDAYLSGPVGMIRSGVDALRGVGVPYERIRHDSLEELVAAAD
ncbi:globin domain-containing protein [Streptomyces sp. NPDC049837]|uniref:globin domain-containing protein n=1 Tax=Streptomyces sp. NPDC049837 TaxID=3155277 RepID=UPI00342A9C65